EVVEEEQAEGQEPPRAAGRQAQPVTRRQVATWVAPRRPPVGRRASARRPRGLGLAAGPRAAAGLAPSVRGRHASTLVCDGESLSGGAVLARARLQEARDDSRRHLLVAAAA